jgi:hypothetical protein
MCVSKFVRIGRYIHQLHPFFEIQYDGRQPSWILSNANYEVTFRKAVNFWLCV